MKLFRSVIVFISLLILIPILGSHVSTSAKNKVTVIINPISGGKKKDWIAKEIIKKLSKTHQIEIMFTEAPQHATTLAKEALGRHTDIIAVVGGDGSVNEVSQAIIGTDATLAIIPTGSGNGFARHLNIPLKVNEAIDLISNGKVEMIDTAKINNRSYLGVAGIGFDAEIGWAFDQFGYRGFFPYMLLTVKEFPKYQPAVYDLLIDGKHYLREAFLISFANSSQFGNGAFIAPKAKVNDGTLDIVIIKKFPSYETVEIVSRLFNHTLHRSKYVEIIKCKEVIIKQKNLKAHIDGEPAFFPDGIEVKVEPSSLKVIIPN